MRLGVIYFSKTDITESLANAVIDGALTVAGTEIYKHRIVGSEIKQGRYANNAVIDELSQCDAIVFGSPTYMGSVSAQFKTFADATSELWCDQKWSGKLAAGFTCGSAINGDQSSTLQYLITFACQHGMLWMGIDAAPGYRDFGINRMGCQLGTVAYCPDGQIHEIDLATAKYQGKRIAEQLNKMGKA